MSGRKVARPDLTLAVADHNVPTTDRSQGIEDPESRLQVETLEMNTKEFGIQYFGMSDVRQGIVHIIGPEQGFTMPGATIVCGDSHTSTHGAFGSLAFGIGTSEVEHVLATQTLLLQKSKNMLIDIHGDLPLGVTSKDLALHIIGKIGTAGGTGHVIEYAGQAIRGLSMESRMAICNMSIEGGARAGMVAPDDITYRYLKGKPMSQPDGNWTWEQAVKYWETLKSDPEAEYDKVVDIYASDIAPQVTWGTSPEDVSPITGYTPDPSMESDPNKANSITRALTYMGLKPNQKLTEVPIDKVFIGSCTNARIEDMREAAKVAKGNKVADGVHAMIVPGSGLVKMQAEEEGLVAIFKEAGFDWREPGCSMCLAMNADRLEPGERCASTSNRNFEGRQGRGGRTHLVSPGMAAAAAITGTLADVRKFGSRGYGTLASGRRAQNMACGCTKNANFSTSPNPNIQFTEMTAIAAPLPITNVDTDMIIPKQFLKTIKRTGLGKSLFFEMRFVDDNGTEQEDFILNQSHYRNSRILVAGDNFGCGSSREHAPWALADFGIRCVISTSFADIFFNNCFKNGILPIVLEQKEVDELMSVVSNPASTSVTVDLEQQKIKFATGNFSFDVDPYRKHCLLDGLDDIGLTEKYRVEIADFEIKRSEETPWL